MTTPEEATLLSPSLPSTPEPTAPEVTAPEAAAPDVPDGPTFADFGLDARLIRAVAGLGYATPTPIQARAISSLLAGHDVIGRARTGSGKTAAYGLPLLERVKSGRASHSGVRALVLTPTRELALQVSTALKGFADGLPVEIATVYGGAAYGPQLNALRSGAPVVVGTPGRLIDHLERGALDLGAVEIVVLDEADEMLRMGFIDDVEQILLSTPSDRQIALFSATLPDPIRAIADKHLRDAREIQVEERALTVHHISQRWLRVPSPHKLEALERILRGEPRGTTLVFARTRAACAEVADALHAHGFAVDALHGDLDQPARERVMSRLRSGALDLVIATDVAARGLDVDHITHVINLDLPHDTETYVHRIGRTGRAGREGQAISFVTPQQMQRVRELERTLKVRLEEMTVPTDAQLAARKRTALREELARALEAHGFDAVQLAVEELLTASGWTAEDLAAAAVRLLAEARQLELGVPHNPEPPAWARPPARAPWGADRPERGDARALRTSPRGPRASGEPGRGPRAERGEHDVASAVIALPVGRARGLRPADVVGVLANALGIPGAHIGRIDIGERDTLVGLAPEDAARVVEGGEPLYVRGRPIWPRWHEAPGAGSRRDDDRRGPPQRGPRDDDRQGPRGGGPDDRRGPPRGYAEDRGPAPPREARDDYRRGHDRGPRDERPRSAQEAPRSEPPARQAPPARVEDLPAPPRTEALPVAPPAPPLAPPAPREERVAAPPVRPEPPPAPREEPAAPAPAPRAPVERPKHRKAAAPRPAGPEPTPAPKAPPSKAPGAAAPAGKAAPSKAPGAATPGGKAAHRKGPSPRPAGEPAEPAPSKGERKPGWAAPKSRGPFRGPPSGGDRPPRRKG